jgi:hypothetical protein
MVMHILEDVLSHSAAITQREQNVGNHHVDQASAVVSDTAISPGRRCEARMDYRRMCSYEVFESIGKSRSSPGKERPSLSTGARKGCFSSQRWSLTRSS